MSTRRTILKKVRLVAALIVLCFFAQDAKAIPIIFASVDLIRGRVVAIDSKTGSKVNGYTIEVDASVNQERLAKIRKALISHTRYEYRNFERPRPNQALLLVEKHDDLRIKIGDLVEVTGYTIIGPDASGSKDGRAQFRSFTVVTPKKQ